jgi:hypothetical protein
LSQGDNLVIYQKEGTHVAFNKEDKVTLEELSPTLQTLLSNTITIADFNTVKAEADKIIQQIGDNRISIVGNVGSISDPQNDKELAIETSTGLSYRYKNGWIPNGAVYG